jgi:drug/metabolite transporter (DMT)-like permease
MTYVRGLADDLCGQYRGGDLLLFALDLGQTRPPVRPELMWQPALFTLCLFGGQLTQFIALDWGGVSVVVPAFGLKVILIAFLSPFITGDPVSPGLWLAVLLSVAGVTFLNQRTTARTRRGKSGAVFSCRWRCVTLCGA